MKILKSKVAVQVTIDPESLKRAQSKVRTELNKAGRIKVTLDKTSLDSAARYLQNIAKSFSSSIKQGFGVGGTLASTVSPDPKGSPILEQTTRYRDPKTGRFVSPPLSEFTAPSTSKEQVDDSISILKQISDYTSHILTLPLQNEKLSSIMALIAEDTSELVNLLKSVKIAPIVDQASSVSSDTGQNFEIMSEKISEVTQSIGAFNIEMGDTAKTVMALDKALKSANFSSFTRSILGTSTALKLISSKQSGYLVSLTQLGGMFTKLIPVLSGLFIGFNLLIALPFKLLVTGVTLFGKALMGVFSILTSVAKGIFSIVRNVFKTILSTAVTIGRSIYSALNSVVLFVAGPFTRTGRRIIKGFTDIFDSIWSAITGVLGPLGIGVMIGKVLSPFVETMENVLIPVLAPFQMFLINIANALRPIVWVFVPIIQSFLRQLEPIARALRNVLARLSLRAVAWLEQKLIRFDNWVITKFGANWEQLFEQRIIDIGKAFYSGFTWTKNIIIQIFSPIAKIFKQLFDTFLGWRLDNWSKQVPRAMGGFFDRLKYWAEYFAKWLEDNWPSIADTLETWISETVKDLKRYWNNLSTIFSDISAGIKWLRGEADFEDISSSFFQKVFSVAYDIIKGIKALIGIEGTSLDDINSERIKKMFTWIDDIWKSFQEGGINKKRIDKTLSIFDSLAEFVKRLVTVINLFKKIPMLPMPGTGSDARRVDPDKVAAHEAARSERQEGMSWWERRMDDWRTPMPDIYPDDSRSFIERWNDMADSFTAPFLAIKDIITVLRGGEAPDRTSNMPSAATGGVVTKTGAVLVHAGEVIRPVSQLDKDTSDIRGATLSMVDLLWKVNATLERGFYTTTQAVSHISTNDNRDDLSELTYLGVM